MPLSASQRRTRAKVGAHALHARYDGAELTQKARAAFLASFMVKVDPQGLLPPQERQRRAAHALRAHMARLSLVAAQSRERRKAGSMP